MSNLIYCVRGVFGSFYGEPGFDPCPLPTGLISIGGMIRFTRSFICGGFSIGLNFKFT